MSRYTDRILIVVSLFICAASPVAAEDLMEIYERAVQYDPVLRQAEAIYLARLEARQQARSALLPCLWL